MTSSPEGATTASTTGIREPATSGTGSFTGGQFTAALRDPGLRRFASGTLAWGIAHQMVTASQGFVLFEMTGSTLWIAWLGAAVGVPNIIAAIIGGVLSDRIQRRTLLMIGSAIVALPMIAIAVLYATDTLEPWHVLVAGAAQGTSLALDWISRLSLLPSLVPRRILVSAISLDQSVFNLARVAGPLITAGILATAGPSVSYGVIAGLFGAAIMVYVTFKPQAKAVGSNTEKIGFGSAIRELKEAGTALKADSVLSLNMVFTAMNAMMMGGFVFMIPPFVKEVFDSDELGLGIIFSATGGGAFLGALVVAKLGGNAPPGRGLLISNLLFAGAVALYTTTDSIVLAGVVAFFAGLFNAFHVALGISLIQVNVPDEIRGRVTGAYEIAWSSFPLGGLVIGSLAYFTGLRGAVAIGSLVVALLTVTIYVLSPKLRGLTLNR